MTTPQKKLIERDAIKYVGYNLPLQEKALARHTFKEGAQFALSIANPWIKIEEGGFPDRDSTLWCWSKEWGAPDFLRLVWIIENGQRVWWLYRIDEYEKINPVPLIVDEDIFPTHYFLPPLPPTE